TGRNKVDSFAKLYTYWQEVLSVNILNTKFYRELSKWYFWAIKEVQFPGKPTFEDAVSKKAELKDLEHEHKAENVIRMLTRLLFVWFLKEKQLIPGELFDLKALQEDILNDIDPIKQNGFFKEQNVESVYYKAILQNLFFATLNCPIEGDSIDKRKRGFRKGSSNFGTLFLMRYEEHFKDNDSFLKMMNQTVPFLNGGLFECLDERGEEEKKDERIWIDGFSDNLPKDQQLVVPDYLFFGLEERTDLSDVVGINTNEYKQADVKGLISILESYKFTITENTPIEEDVALDPELLGKVFENLLASYNPETKTTARKQTGSFYTPREIVNYMVDESLIAYLTTVLEASSFEKDTVLEASSFEKGKGNPKQDASVTSQATFLDPNSEIEISQGLLPHWKQDNVFYFVTFRLADSIPSDKQQELKNDREKWNKNKKDKKDYTKEEWKEYNRLFNNRVEDWLNAGYGSCLLGKPENASIVANALKHFDNQRYFLDEWVVMPNHVHVLVKPLGENKITDILHSWKSYTANEINKREGRVGQLWMRESYDHIVRNEDSLNHIRNYIQQNPEKAGITVTEASNVLEASSFEKFIPKQDASGTSIPKQDASGTLQDELRQLVSFDPTNPFIDNKQISKEIITALSTCTIIDPACGSGAFPMGILQKMVHILQKLDPSNEIWFDVQFERANEESRNVFGQIEDEEGRQERLDDIYQAFDQTLNDPDYARKLFLIENCIFGVDIQPIATQISKLRFFISLVVDQKVNPEKKNFGIRALPNLETKFVAANTLIGIDRPKKGDQLNIFNTDKQKKLEAELKIVRSKLFSAKTRATKVKYRNRDEELRNEIAAELLKNGWESDKAQKLAGWDPYDQNASSPFFDPEWMFDIKEGFDVVIGNPPYKVLSTKEPLIEIYKGKYSTTKGGKVNLYKIFIEKGVILLNNSGVLSYITPYNYLTSRDSFELRNLIVNHTQIIEIIDYEEDQKVFENVTQAVATLVLIKGSNKNYSYKYYKNNELFNVFIDNVRNNKKLLLKGTTKPITEIQKQPKLFSDYIIGFQGEINVSTKKQHFTLLKTENSLPLIRGNHIDVYKLISSPQEFCSVEVSNRIHHNKERIVFQEVSNTGLKKRVKAVMLKNMLCGHTTNYIIPVKDQFKWFFLGLINS
ncbi:MAG TPA: Eco57I restriction-modification methylase domain-containing protein, partial [Dysgonamonadaceae bacterium]|nr:Eco57I restriction-modification methylase domain-containing protein [Dysgonamonadaceae bacterium]